MAVARANSLLNKEFGSKQRAADQIGASRTRVSQATLVLEHTPDLADAVLAGGSRSMTLMKGQLKACLFQAGTISPLLAIP